MVILILNQSNSLIKKIQRIPKPEIKRAGKTKAEMYQMEYHHLVMDNQNMSKDLFLIYKKKQRLQYILEICENDMHQGEKWVSFMKILISNYDKMIDFERQKVAKDKKDIETIEKLNEEYAEQFTENITKEYEYIAHLKLSIDNQKELSTLIHSSNFPFIL